jgi:hypothetical protein
MKFRLHFGLTLSVIVVSLFSIFPSTASAAPIEITTCSELQSITSTGLNSDYEIANDINCSGIANFAPIGTFRGTLNGQGYTISGLTIDRNGTNNIGLFSVTNGALIWNLTISGADIGGNNYVGGLVGSASNTIIYDVTVSSGTTMFGSSYVGGLAGAISNSRIIHSNTAIPINAGSSYVGGLVGQSSSGSEILKSYSTSQVAGSTTTAFGGNVGGLVGNNDSSTITDSYSRSNVVGGIFWVNSAAGLVGVNNGATASIVRSYSKGSITINGDEKGLVASQTNDATTTDSYWDTTTSGTASSAAGTGKNTTQMQTQGTFTNWDFTDIWTISASQYPSLRAGDVTPPASATGFTAVATGSNVHLEWTNPGDGDFAGVDIYQSTSFSPSTPLYGSALITGTTDETADDNSIADGTYYYSVMAYDTSGNYAVPARATVRVDTTGPSTPTSITASATTSTVSLSWTNPGDADFTSITIRRSTVGYSASVSDGAAVDSGNTNTSYSDTSLDDDVYYYSIFALDDLGNSSSAGQVSVEVNTVLPVLTIVSAVSTPTNDTTPSFSFSTTKAGTITYAGSCSSGTTAATAGTNTISFNALAEGEYSNCTITVTDAYGNVSVALSVTTFIVDTTAPVLTADAQVSTPTQAQDAVYTFSTTEEGTYSLSGCSGSVNSTAHTVTFTGLSNGTYSCTLTVTDSAGNTSNTLSIGPFVIYLPGGGSVVIEKVEPLGSEFTVNVGTIFPTKFGHKVELIFNANPATVKGYAFSLKPDFGNAGIYPYKSKIAFDLPYTSGVHKVYIKLYSLTGHPINLEQTVVIDKEVEKKSNSIPENKTINTESNELLPLLELSRSLYRGLSGSDVLILQKFLNKTGFVLSETGVGSPGEETEYFGPLTHEAVIRYQAANNIDRIGVVGPLTRASIKKDLNAE